MSRRQDRLPAHWSTYLPQPISVKPSTPRSRIQSLLVPGAPLLGDESVYRFSASHVEQTPTVVVIEVEHEDEDDDVDADRQRDVDDTKVIHTL